MGKSSKLQLVAMGLGLIVFGVLMVELVEEKGPARGRETKRAVRADSGAPSSALGGADAGPHAPAPAADADASPADAERRRAAFAAGGAPRLGDRLDPASGDLEAPPGPAVEYPAVVVPTSGEGAQADGWDGLSSAGRIDKATREVEAALAQASAAGSEEERERWRTRASHALSAARADFYGSSGEANYAELESRIGG